MPSDEARRKAVEWVAERLKKTSNGKVDSETAHRESARIARETDRKNNEKKGG